MKKAKLVFTANEVTKAIKELAKSIAANKSDLKSLALIGIYTRGLTLAKRLQEELESSTKKKTPLGALDITLYRDDLATVGPAPIVKATDINFNLTDKVVILVDDVLYTGRTVRAALNELSDFGRPKCIRLAVLIDRGHRELPIAADYAGKTIATKDNEIVEVRFEETDGFDEVRLK
ncbi:MAG: bifunctional pyr operon transcriptional regulator/uracil phosphoribosyltransferase PyrR [Planctomycetes bacterium]|nr:bifunctional pyr operon transcriptional regulator/uracil phosphoribosyltransferase PyrR [Planctomycetota bacterium]